MDPQESIKNRYLPLHSSGVEAVDSSWGGVYRGGAYLYYGEAAAGRSLLTLLFAAAGNALGEQTILISSDRYSELVIQSGSLGIDLEEVLELGNLHLVRIPPQIKLRDLGDDGVAQALHNLISPFKTYRPERIVINDFMPFVAFRSFERFRIEYVRFLEETDSLGATLIMAMPEPANDHSQRVIDFMMQHVTGCIHIERNKADPGSTRRTLTLIPVFGHIKRFTFEHWDLEDIVSTTPRSETPQIRRDKYSDKKDIVLKSDDPASSSAKDSPSGFLHTPLVISPEVTKPLPSTSEENSEVESVIDDLLDIAEPSAIPVTRETMDPVQIDPLTLPVGSGLDVDITNKAAFVHRIERAAASANELGDTFVLLALRLEKEGEDDADAENRAIGFEFILDVVHDILRPHDDMLADMEGEQVTVLLAHASEDDTDEFFRQLRDQLTAQAPQRGEQLLSKIAAIVAKNGEPFKSIADFVDYAFVGQQE